MPKVCKSMVNFYIVNALKDLHSQLNLPHNLSKLRGSVSNWVKFESTLSDLTTAQWGALSKSCQFIKLWNVSWNIFLILLSYLKRSVVLYLYLLWAKEKGPANEILSNQKDEDHGCFTNGSRYLIFRISSKDRIAVQPGKDTFNHHPFWWWLIYPYLIYYGSEVQWINPFYPWCFNR